MGTGLTAFQSRQQPYQTLQTGCRGASARAGGVQSPDYSQERGDHLIDSGSKVEYKGAGESASANIVSMAQGANGPELEASMEIASDSLVLGGTDAASVKIRLAIFPTTNAAGGALPLRVGQNGESAE